MVGRIFEPALRWAASRYQAAVCTELRKYGLRYEDLYDPLLNMVRLPAHMTILWEATVAVI